MPYMLRKLYYADGGEQFGLRISPEIANVLASGGQNAFGWNSDAVSSDLRVPKGLRLRTIDLVSANGAVRRRVPVGAPGQSALWANPGQTVQLQLQDGSFETFSVTGRGGERRTLS